MMLEIGQCRLNVFASIVIWTNQLISYVKEPWIELVIIVKPENQTGTNLDSKMDKVFLKILTMFSKIFQETGVYVTNEMQDGEAFIGIVGGLEEKLWEFDYAIIPSHHLLHYQNVPEDFNSCTIPSGICFLINTA